MPNPFQEMSAAAVTALSNLDTPITAVRTRMHRFSPQHFATMFGDNPVVIVSKGNLDRGLNNQCRDSRVANVTLMVTIVDDDERCDPTDTATQDIFDEFVNTVEKGLATYLQTTTYGRAVWTNTTEVDDNDITRGLGEFLTTLEITYRLESTEV